MHKRLNSQNLVVYSFKKIVFVKVSNTFIAVNHSLESKQQRFPNIYTTLLIDKKHKKDTVIKQKLGSDFRNKSKEQYFRLFYRIMLNDSNVKQKNVKLLKR